MRPPQLNALFAPATTLPGIGAKVAASLPRALALPTAASNSAGNGDGTMLPEARVIDLLFHLPSGTIDDRNRPTIARALPGERAVLEVHVDEHAAPHRSSRAPYRIACHDETGDLVLVFFNARAEYLQRTLPVGETRFVAGIPEQFGDSLQIVHPEIIGTAEDLAKRPAVLPVYPLAEGVRRATLVKAIDAALERLPTLPEWLPSDILAIEHWPDFASALKDLHQPDVPDRATPGAAAWRRLAFDELLAGQLALALIRKHTIKRGGRARMPTGALSGPLWAHLPFEATGAQTRVCAEIDTDLASDQRMVRLLQGDVGSGKTLVALHAMLGAIESGSQAALMAPTEILARQHAETIATLAKPLGLETTLLTGKNKAADRRDKRAQIASGQTQLVLGTHALFQRGLEFADLGLVVVDEQHRFGVHQRLALSAKGEVSDLLVMTATPIPRTLLLGLYGDMAVSRLDEKPPGRTPIDTRALPEERLGDVVAGIGRAMADGGKFYWVCPMVAESEVSDLAAAEDRFKALNKVFSGQVALVHGRMGPEEKAEAVARFRSGETPLLVATTVIEVGVDVPDATGIVIEHAERFGLAQLHQLRGRVGRSDKPSSCLLIYRPPLGETARARIDVMRNTEDGFRIAEEDLRLRGGGDMLGTRQSGMPGFRIADTGQHLDLLELARKQTARIMDSDPDLKGKNAEALRTLLYL
jgi:ATP-dependent DNA helicase RecG